MVVAGLIGSVTVFTGASLATVANAESKKDDDRPTVRELKLKNAWVPKNQDLQFGAEPLEMTRAAAAEAAGAASCSIGEDAALALVIAMTWPEVAPSGEPPSPMTLSRYDTQPELGDPSGRAEGLWFHPGIGMWQMDSAGLGNDYTASEAMDVQYTAGRAAPYIIGKYCDAVNGGSSEASARATAWSDWVACGNGACEDVYQRVLANGVTPVDGVGRYGGAEVRECEYDGQTLPCTFVDPANAQGANWWAAPGGGRSPIAAPFYVLKLDNDPATEVRYWLAEDSGAGEDVSASRPFGGNARDSLTWETGSGLCDTTAGRGSC